MHEKPPGRPKSLYALASSRRKFAVLIDGSALYLAAASLPMEGMRLNYPALVEVLVRTVEGLQPPGLGSDSLWTMWTSATPANSGQMKFLEFAEQRLRWTVRAAAPSDSFMIEPETLFGIGAEAAKKSRLLRFDASIAFAMGRLAETHHLVVVSDSFALRDAMTRASDAGKGKVEPCTLAFFEQSLDRRWVGRLDGMGHRFINLDDYQAELFGIERKEVPRLAEQPGVPIY